MARWNNTYYIWISILAAFLLFPRHAFSIQFDELDKPPEGAHQGQMLLGAFFSIGPTLGSTITAEKDFVRNNTYTFAENGVTKKMMITHLSFGVGVLYEYMPLDYLGVKTKLKSGIITQRTLFGPQFENWSENMYVDFSFNVGPSAHLTNRKQWDITLTPVVGYAVGVLKATPIANKLLTDIGYIPSTKKTIHGFTCGAELNFTAYFSGGLFISLGFDWTMNMIQFKHAYTMTNPLPPNPVYFDGKTSSLTHSLGFIFSCGYAFSN